MNNLQKNAINHLLFHCGGLQWHDKTLILCNPETQALAQSFYQIGVNAGYNVVLMEIPPLSHHGDNPPNYAADAMQAATLIISLCHYSLAHSQARINAGLTGARFLSLPLYHWELLEHPCLHIDFKSQAQTVRRIAQAFTEGRRVHVTTKMGTDVHLDITGRVGNYCPGFVEHAGDLGSPPDIEANISPVEEASEGIVMVDGSITHPLLGLMTSPIKLTIRQGRIIEFSGKNKQHVDCLETMFSSTHSRRRILAECGIGLNPAATLTGTMLTDEGVLGCVHFGFGSNNTMGGKNKVDFHLDFVFQQATVVVDDHYLLKEGTLQE